MKQILGILLSLGMGAFTAAAHASLETTLPEYEIPRGKGLVIYVNGERVICYETQQVHAPSSSRYVDFRSREALSVSVTRG